MSVADGSENGSEIDPRYLGMALGAGVGGSLWMVLDSPVVGLAVGLSIGVAVATGALDIGPSERANSNN